MAHLDRCADCTAHVAQVRATIDLLRQAEPEPVDPTVVSELMVEYAKRYGARRPTFFDLATSPRHLMPAFKLTLVVSPILALVNHSICLLHWKLGLACLGQSLAMAVVPFAVALFVTARYEMQSQN